jgi:Fe-S-cluster containining protein
MFLNLDKCRKCVKEGGGCCDGEDSGIFCTLHDALRISKATGMNIEKIVTFGKVAESFIQSMKEQDNEFYEIYVNDRVLQLKRKRKHCQFLTPKGCSIIGSRPLLCRLFPFSYDEDDSGNLIVTLPKTDNREDEDCTICSDNFGANIDVALKDMAADKNAMLKLIMQSMKELEIYEEYAPLIAEGKSYEEIIEQFKIKV